MCLLRGFVVSRFLSIYFTINGVKKIVMSRTLLYRGSLNQGSTER